MLLLFTPSANAAFPEKPIQFIVGWQAGDGTDLSARTLCHYAEKYLKEPFVISNVPGGSGGKAYTSIAKANADGYTLGTTTSSIATLKSLGMIQVDSDDMQPIIAYSEDPTALWVKWDAPWKTLQEFIAYAKQRPGEVKVSASNPGSITRFQMMALEQEAGLEFRVLSGGNAPGLLALAGGHVDAAFGTPPSGASLYAGQKIRPLGFTSGERLPFFPEVPTFKEQGINIVMTTTRIVIGPKGIPADVVNTLYTAFKKATEDKEFRDNLNKRGTSWLDWDPERCRQEMNKQNAQFKALIEKVGNTAK